jgi:hypothetical protein
MGFVPLHALFDFCVGSGRDMLAVCLVVYKECDYYLDSMKLRRVEELLVHEGVPTEAKGTVSSGEPYGEISNTQRVY